MKALLLLAGAASGMINSGTPDGVPASFDCALRALAYDYGRALRPDRGEFRTLFDALQLESCGQPAPAEADAYAPPAYDAPPAARTLVHVAAADGDDDAGDGSLARPFATIARGVRAAAAAAAQPAAVLLRGGVYREPTVQLGPEHAGLTIQNYGGERAEVSGARALARASPWFAYKRFAGFERHDRANNVYGQVAAPGASTAAIAYLGDFDDYEGCEAAARAAAARDREDAAALAAERTAELRHAADAVAAAEARSG